MPKHRAFIRITPRRDTWCYGMPRCYGMLIWSMSWQPEVQQSLMVDVPGVWQVVHPVTELPPVPPLLG
jgi:hypothetical protein